VTKFVAANIGNQLSPSSISKYLKTDNRNIHHSTVEKFLEYLVESFVFYKVNRFDIKGKKQLATQEKYYLVNLRLMNIFSGREKQPTGDISWKMLYIWNYSAMAIKYGQAL
jgi:predicted AAA+ superfamily ATPase